MNNRIIGWTLFLGISTLLAVGCSNNNTELASNNKPVIVSPTPEEQQLATKKGGGITSLTNEICWSMPNLVGVIANDQYSFES